MAINSGVSRKKRSKSLDLKRSRVDWILSSHKKHITEVKVSEQRSNDRKIAALLVRKVKNLKKPPVG